MHVHVRVCLAHCPAGANMNVLIVLPIAIAVHACASQTNKVGNELIPMLVGSLLFLVPWLLLHRSQPPLNLMPVDAGAGTYVHTATPQPPARLAPRIMSFYASTGASLALNVWNGGGARRSSTCTARPRGSKHACIRVAHACSV